MIDTLLWILSEVDRFLDRPALLLVPFDLLGPGGVFSTFWCVLGDFIPPDAPSHSPFGVYWASYWHEEGGCSRLKEMRKGVRSNKYSLSIYILIFRVQIPGYYFMLFNNVL